MSLETLTFEVVSDPKLFLNTISDLTQGSGKLESVAPRDKDNIAVRWVSTMGWHKDLEIPLLNFPSDGFRNLWQRYGCFYPDVPVGQYHVQDAILGLMSLPDESVDLVLTDPAYDTLEKWREIGTTTRLKESKASSNQWFGIVPVNYFVPFYRECYRVLKSGRHMYTLCNPDMAYELQPMLRKTSMTTSKGKERYFDYRHTLIWEKVGQKRAVTCQEHDVKLRCPVIGCTAEHTVQGSGLPGMGYPYRRCYESILLHQKGKMSPMGSRNVRDVLKVPRLKGEGYYPTQKPEELLETFILQSTEPDWIVCDPFAGSGSTLKVAHRLGRRFYGTDISKEAQEGFKLPEPQQTEF